MKKVTGIEIEVGGKKVLLSEEDARQLYADLDRLFGRPDPVVIPYPVYPSIQPCYHKINWGDRTSGDPLPPYPITTC